MTTGLQQNSVSYLLLSSKGKSLNMILDVCET